MQNDWPWYTTVDSSEDVAQGDFLEDYPVLIPQALPEPGGRIAADVRQYSVVVLTQSCDLALAKVDSVLICPYYNYRIFADRNPTYGSKKGVERLRRGAVFGYHLLSQCEIDGFCSEGFVVDFRRVFSTPFQQLMKFARQQDSRLRLLPPYRERLSQAFAVSLMRVAMEQDIDIELG